MTAEIPSPHISQITDYLYISAWPRGEHIAEIVALGVRLVLSMHWIRPTKTLGKPPVQLLWLPTIDKPFFPMPMKTLKKGVRAALPVIQDGDSVLVHCIAGVHRSVAQAACVLIGMGYSADQAMRLIKEKRTVADPYVPYIQKRIRKFEQQWQDQKPLE
jgi:protein-tyrosine phosphatase